jgi:hypothetical protein
VTATLPGGALGNVAVWHAQALSRALAVVGYGLVGLGLALYIRAALRLFRGIPGDWRRAVDDVRRWAEEQRRQRMVAFVLVVTGSGLLVLSRAVSGATP